MEITRGKVLDYYQQTANGAYDRWGGETGAYHFGYFKSLRADILGKQPEEVQKMHIRSHKNMLRLVTRFINPKEGELVVDAGCGSGSMLPYLSKSGAQVIGLNITPEHLLKAQKRINELGLPNTSVVGADFVSVPLPTASVNKVLFFESLTHASDQEKVLMEADRVLKINGEIIIIEPMLTQNRSGLDATTYFNVREIDKGMCLQVSSTPYLMHTLEKLGYSTDIRDITPHVVPSMELAAASAEAHQSENVQESIFRHRSATIAYRDLTKNGKLQYLMMKARKI